MICRASETTITWNDIGISTPLHLQDKPMSEVIYLARYNHLRQTGVSTKHTPIITNFFREAGYFLVEPAFSENLRFFYAACTGLSLEEYEYRTTKCDNPNYIAHLNQAYEARHPYSHADLDSTHALLRTVLNPIQHQIVTDYYGLDYNNPQRLTCPEIANHTGLPANSCQKHKVQAVARLNTSSARHNIVRLMHHLPLSLSKNSQNMNSNLHITSLGLKPRVAVALRRRGIDNAQKLMQTDITVLTTIPNSAGKTSKILCFSSANPSRPSFGWGFFLQILHFFRKLPQKLLHPHLLQKTP